MTKEPDSSDQERARIQWEAYDRASSRYEMYERARQLYRARQHRDALAAYVALAAEDPGNADVLLQIGSMYHKGEGTGQQAQEAEQWIQKAVALGSPAAEYYLAAIRSQQGRHTESVELLERATARGYTPAMYHLGVMYALGHSVPLDRHKAHDLFGRAAERGHVLAQRQYALSLMRGERGVTKIPVGLLMMVRALVNSVRFYVADPSDERIQP